MTNYKKDRYGVIFAVLCIILCVLGLFRGSPNTAYAADTATYSDVLADLQKDESFNAADYPAVDNDYSLHVIQIAESSDGELLVYVYQPSRITTALTATELNMALSDSVDTTALFGLTLLNSNGVFCKYRVDGVTVSSDPVRYYNISSIYREWDSVIDGDPGNGNTGNAKAYEIGWLWTVQTSDNAVSYSKTRVDTIKVTDFYVGHLRYYNKSFFYAEAVDCFYVAFSTDWRIDKLLRATVDFSYGPYVADVHIKYGEETVNRIVYNENVIEHAVAKLDSESSTDIVLNGIKQKSYSLKWIQSSADFIKTETLNESVENKVSEHPWVLRFFASSLKMLSSGGGISGYSGDFMVNGNAPREVTILQLSFETAGKTYDLGVVSNKQTGGLSWDNKKESSDLFAKFLAWVKRIMSKLFGISADKIPDWAAVLFIVGVVMLLGFLLILIMPFMPFILSALVAVFKAIGKGLVWLFKGLIYVISLPVRGIAALVQKIRGKA